jgi:hypothetical protein
MTGALDGHRRDVPMAEGVFHLRYVHAVALVARSTCGGRVHALLGNRAVSRAISCNDDPSWPGKRVLLTSDAHMFRAYRTFLKAKRR